MNKLLQLLLLTSFLSIMSALNVAQAQDTYTLYKVPAGRRVTVASGEVLQGYTLKEVKQLLAVDAELQACDAKTIQLNNQVTAYVATSLNLKTIVDLKEEKIGLLQADLLRKDTELTDVIYASIELEDKLVLRKRLLRIGGGVVGALVGGLVLGLILK